MHPALDDQQFYDLMFGFYRAIVLLAGAAREAERARQAATIRALRAEVKLKNAQIERDYYKAFTERTRAQRQAWARKQRRAA
jgi:hypothetical protein